MMSGGSSGGGRYLFVFLVKSASSWGCLVGAALVEAIGQDVLAVAGGYSRRSIYMQSFLPLLLHPSLPVAFYHPHPSTAITMFVSKTSLALGVLAVLGGSAIGK